MNRFRVGKRLWPGPALAAMLVGCALPMIAQTSQMSVWARSHNRSLVDVYLLCGDRDAQWLGVIHPNEAAVLEFPYKRTRCVQGLNFFLVDRDHNRGHWVGPMHPLNSSGIELVVEKYAGLSSASLMRE
jgi:hypothetical protein